MGGAEYPALEVLDGLISRPVGILAVLVGLDRCGARPSIHHPLMVWCMLVLRWSGVTDACLGVGEGTRPELGTLGDHRVCRQTIRLELCVREHGRVQILRRLKAGHSLWTTSRS